MITNIIHVLISNASLYKFINIFTSIVSNYLILIILSISDDDVKIIFAETEKWW